MTLEFDMKLKVISWCSFVSLLSLLYDSIGVLSLLFLPASKAHGFAEEPKGTEFVQEGEAKLLTRSCVQH